jgi:HAD superfamily hydrolase (TIGR01509 family)
VSELQRRGVRMAIASSSRNAEAVVERLGIRAALDALVDANTAERSKPDPQVFVAAAERLRVPRERCVVLEDAEAGVAAALTAGMRVIGIGPRERVGNADLVVDRLSELDADRVLSVVHE